MLDNEEIRLLIDNGFDDLPLNEKCKYCWTPARRLVVGGGDSDRYYYLCAEHYEALRDEMRKIYYE